MSSSVNKSVPRKRGTTGPATGTAKRAVSGTTGPATGTAKRAVSGATGPATGTAKRTVSGATRRSTIGTTRRSTRQADAVNDGSNCIDLTCDCDAEIVDLTNYDMSPISLNCQSTPLAGRRRSSRVESVSVPSASSIQPLSICLLDDCEHCCGNSSPDELPEFDFGQFLRKEPAPARVISCPICFDTDQEISKSGNHLMSTTCGHIFCNNCISESIQKNRCCPTCRKRLTPRQIHPIFL